MRHGYELKSSKYGIKASSNWILEGKNNTRDKSTFFSKLMLRYIGEEYLR